MTTAPTPEYLPTRVVAARLGVSAATVRDLISAGAIEGVRVGRLLRVEAASVDRYLSQQRVGRTATGQVTT